MSTVKTWSTKEDVLRDLAEASGSRAGELNEEYLVVGARPPPIHAENFNDDEMNLLFGGEINEKHTEDMSEKPDLEGITHMLRTVLDNDVPEDDFDINPENAVISISKIKLNPNVKEFVPKSSKGFSATSCNTGSTDLTNSLSLVDKPTKTDSTNIENNIDINFSNNDTKTCYENDLKCDDVKILAEELKTKISDSSKLDSFENKRQKNVAIATLLKLYATNSQSSSKEKSTGEQNVKLLTPQDFEKKNDQAPNSNECISQERTGIASHDGNKPLLGSETPSKSQTTSSSFNSSSSTPVHHILDPEMRASIDKVNKWFEEPAIKKSPSVFLGSITFKKKESVTSNSPVESTSQKKREPCPTIKQYVPSAYADDLTKMYLERNKNKENISKNKPITLDNLHEVLKKKDLEIKNKQETTST